MFPRFRPNFRLIFFFNSEISRKNILKSVSQLQRKKKKKCKLGIVVAAIAPTKFQRSSRQHSCRAAFSATSAAP
jgi:hypothetical protein